MDIGRLYAQNFRGDRGQTPKNGVNVDVAGTYLVGRAVANGYRVR